MSFELLLQDQLFNWVIMPILIAMARVFDVSLGTIRVVYIAKGFRKIAPIIGFFEVLVWVVVVRQVFANVQNPMWYVGYAAGFGIGTYVGILISEKFSVGEVLIRVITTKKIEGLVDTFEKAGYGITAVDSHGKKSKGTVIFSVVHSTDVENVIKLIHEHNPKAFYTIEDIRKVSEGHLRAKSHRLAASRFMGLLSPFRKGK